MANNIQKYKYTDLLHVKLRFQDRLYDFEKLISFAHIIEGNKCEIFPGSFIQIFFVGECTSAKENAVDVGIKYIICRYCFCVFYPLIYYI